LIRMWRKADPDIGYVKNVTTRSRRLEPGCRHLTTQCLS